MAAASLPRLPWWDADETPVDMAAAIDNARQQLQQHTSAMQMFSKRSLLAFVFMANKLERTLPGGYEDFQTYKMLEEQLLASNEQYEFVSGPEQQTWPAEGGGNTAETRQQLLQFGKATQYLCWPPKRPLTVDSICVAHKLMMWGAVENGHLLDAGKFRTSAAHSGTGYVYPEAFVIPDRLQEIVSTFNSMLSNENQPSYSLAADLLYQFVTLHPFSNGNGRMCRLLAAYAALSAGEPFIMHLSNAHNKTRQHYQQVLRHADKQRGNPARLRSYILDCLHLQWQNALAYTGAQDASRPSELSSTGDSSC